MIANVRTAWWCFTGYLELWAERVLRQHRTTW